MITGIGIGLSDFKALRLRRNYYIDKTEFIKHIIDNQSSVVLITRPRRFGKTLNMTTLRYYFDNRVTDAKELFEMSDIDGGLVGGASLNPDEFSKIVNF